MTKPFDVLAYVRETLDLFDELPLSVVVRRCVRIAHTRADWRALTWLELESHEFGDAKLKDQGLAVDIMNEVGIETNDLEKMRVVQEWMDRRTYSELMGGKNAGLVAGHSVEMIETQLAQVDADISGMVTRPSDTTADEVDRMNARAKLYETKEQHRATRAKVRDALFRFLLRADRELTFGDYNETFFARTKALVDSRLSSISPEAVDRFNGAYRRIRDGDSESLSQSAASCRRVLHALADAACPPQKKPATGPDGISRDLTADKYMNRLLWFVTETRGSHGIGPLLSADIKILADRLEAVDKIGGKGVHAIVSAQEAETLAIHVYVIAAEILRLKDIADVPLAVPVT